LEQLRTALDLSDVEYRAFVEATRRQPTLTVGAPEADPESRRHDNLPVRPTPFVGRAADQARIASLLNSAPVVTLVGPGGVGKTRLALEVAEDQVSRWPDGVWLVELATLSDANVVSASVAAVLGIQQRRGSDLTEDLLEWLRTRQLLLILDNCEYVTQVCARLTNQIVHTCPNVRILATSREVLGIDGEVVWQVNPLSVPDGPPASAASALDSEAVNLFVVRAAAAAPGFRLTDQNAAAVTLICGRLDGLPLALELTAARLRALSVEDIAKRLDQRFNLLTSGNRTTMPRHRTLRALVDWSYDLLDDDEGALFDQLSVFSGGWTLDAVESICTIGEGSNLDCLGQLIDKSLVHTRSQPDGSLPVMPQFRIRLSAHGCLT
jgi:predicted ATPase